jgi:2-iminobutanoate/2-iminopropanoate deaminase
MASPASRVKTVVQADDAPAAIGPYSQAIAFGDLLFCSGQIALDAATGALVDGDVGAQTEQVLANLEAVLRAGGSDWSRVLKATIYLSDMAHFATVNDLYGARFEGMDPPARATVAVAGLPKGVDVEIEVIAARSA